MVLGCTAVVAHRALAWVATARALGTAARCAPVTPVALPRHSLCGVGSRQQPRLHLSRMAVASSALLAPLAPHTAGLTGGACVGSGKRGLATRDNKINVVELDVVGNASKKSFSPKQIRTELRLSRRFAALIDSTMAIRHPVIDVSGHGDSLIISLDETARVIVQRDRALLVDPATIAGERLAVMIQRAVQRPSGPESGFAPVGWVTDDTTRFDLRVLESVLRFVCTSLDDELQVLTARVHEVLEELAVSATDEALQQLVPIKHSLAAFSVQVKEFKGSMEINLSSPRDLNQIEFLLPREFPCHEKSDSPAPASGDTPVDSNGGKAAVQSELAFEVLDEMCWTVDEIENETLQLMANIRASEEVLSITLDKTRNQLIKLNLVATSGAFVAAMGSMAASLFGMNVQVEKFSAVAFPSIPDTALFPVVASTICGLTALSALGFYQWHAELNQSQKYTVVAQAVIDRLHTRYTEIESSSTARFGRSASLTQAEYMRIMGDLCMTVSDAEVKALFVLLGDAGGDTINIDLLLSVLRQHAHANLVRVRSNDMAGLDVMPPHIPLSRMPLPTSRSKAGMPIPLGIATFSGLTIVLAVSCHPGNKFFTIND
eukprot:m.139027 g.139027  ORF g.139027 m.139027 type:complete len:604 (+) comp14008_c0_seq6:1763-3574(+)